MRPIIFLATAFTLLSAAAFGDADEYSPEERAAIERSKEECVKAGILDLSDIEERFWEVYTPENPVLDTSGNPGIIVSLRLNNWGRWVVFGNDIYILNVRNELVTPHLDLYPPVAEYFDASDTGNEILPDNFGILTDPENQMKPIYVTTNRPLFLYSIPSEEYYGGIDPVIGFIPTGTSLPVIFWKFNMNLHFIEEPQIWIRTEYNDTRGWICAVHNDESYVDRDGGPLFTLKVAVDKLKFGRDIDYRYEPPMSVDGIWLNRGDEVGFLNQIIATGEDINWEDTLVFRVSYDGELGYIYARDRKGRGKDHVSNEDYAELDWFVEFEPEFYDLNFYSKIRRFCFETVNGEIAKYNAPGEYKQVPRIYEPYLEFDPGHTTNLPPILTVAVFASGNWIMTKDNHDVYEWVKLGMADNPNIRLVDHIPNFEWYEGIDLDITVERELWPLTNKYYFLFYPETVLNKVSIYQPRGSTEPIYETEEFGEGGIRGEYGIGCVYNTYIPSKFDPDCPYDMYFDVEIDGKRFPELETIYEDI